MGAPATSRAPMPSWPQATGAPAAAAIATGAGTTITTFAGATIATGAIANTATDSTGAFAASAAVFMGVPALPPPQGRQTSDHLLDAEQDISTAASTIVNSAAGATSTGTAFFYIEGFFVTCYIGRVKFLRFW